MALCVRHRASRTSPGNGFRIHGADASDASPSPRENVGARQCSSSPPTHCERRSAPSSLQSSARTVALWPAHVATSAKAPATLAKTRTARSAPAAARSVLSGENASASTRAPPDSRADSDQPGSLSLRWRSRATGVVSASASSVRARSTATRPSANPAASSFPSPENATERPAAPAPTSSAAICARRSASHRRTQPSEPSVAHTGASGCHATASNVPPAPAMRTRARVASASHKSHAVVPAKQATREKRGEPLAEPLADADADASEVASSVSSSASVSSASAQGVTPRGFVGNRPGGRGSSSPSTPQGRSAARAAGAFRSSTPFFSREAAVSEALVRLLVSSAPSARSREATTASDLIRGGAWFAPIGCDSWISSKGVSSTSSRASVRRHARIRPSAPAETTAFSDSRTASARTPLVFSRAGSRTLGAAPASAWLARRPTRRFSARLSRSNSARPPSSLPTRRFPPGKNAAACAEKGAEPSKRSGRPPHRPAPSRRHSLTCLAPKVTNSNELVADGRFFSPSELYPARRAEDAMGGAGPNAAWPEANGVRDVAGFGTAFATFERNRR